MMDWAARKGLLINCSLCFSDNIVASQFMLGTVAR